MFLNGVAGKGPVLWGGGLVLHISVTVVTSNEVEPPTSIHEERSARVPRSLFSSFLGAVFGTRHRGGHNYEATAADAEVRKPPASQRRIDVVQAVQQDEEDFIQKTPTPKLQNQISKNITSLFGSIFSEVDVAADDNDLQLVSTEKEEATTSESSNQNYANETSPAIFASSKGVFDDIANGISSLFGGAGPAVDSGPEALNLVPNNCWYRGEKYECALSLTCAMQGRKSLDLCNGGLIWTCCVDRDKIDRIDPDLGALSDAKCGEIYSGDVGRGLRDADRQSRIVGGSNTFFGQHPWQVW